MGDDVSKDVSRTSLSEPMTVPQRVWFELQQVYTGFNRFWPNRHPEDSRNWLREISWEEIRDIGLQYAAYENEIKYVVRGRGRG